MKLAVIYYPGYNEAELAIIVDTLTKAGADLKLFSLGKDYSKHKVLVKGDYNSLDDYDGSFEAVVFPGGVQNVESLVKDLKLRKLIQEEFTKGKLIAAICAAPMVLGEAGILKNLKYSVYPGFEKKTYGELLDQPIVLSDNVLTGRSVYYTHDFCLAIINYLENTLLKEAIEGAIKGIE